MGQRGSWLRSESSAQPAHLGRGKKQRPRSPAISPVTLVCMFGGIGIAEERLEALESTQTAELQ